jgi:hypothetical protein
MRKAKEEMNNEDEKKKNKEGEAEVACVTC